MTAAGGLSLQRNFTDEPDMNHMCHADTLDSLRDERLSQASLFLHLA